MPSIDEIADRPELARELAAPVARAMRWKALRALLALALGEQDQEPTGTVIVPNLSLEVRAPEAASILGVKVSFLLDHKVEYGGFKRGKFWMFSVERLQKDSRRKGLVG